MDGIGAIKFQSDSSDIKLHYGKRKYRYASGLGAQLMKNGDVYIGMWKYDKINGGGYHITEDSREAHGLKCARAEFKDSQIEHLDYNVSIKE